MSTVSSFFARNSKATLILVMAERAFKMFSQLLVIFIMARMLSQEDMGNIIYAYLICSSLFFFNSYGMEQMQVEKMVKGPLAASSFVSNYLALRVITSGFSVFLCIVYALVFCDTDQRNLVFIVSIVHFYYVFSFFDYFFQGMLKQYISSLCLLLGGGLSLIIKVLALYTGSDIHIFALAFISDWLFCALFFLFFFKKEENFPKCNLLNDISLSKVLGLLVDNSGMMFAAGMSMIYMKVDQFFVQEHIGSVALSLYSIPIRLSEAGFFLCTAVVGSVYPKLLKLKIDNGGENHTPEMSRFIFNTFWLLFLSCLVASFLSKNIILTFFGSEFEESAGIFSLTVFSIPFVFLGSVVTRLLIERNLKKSLIFRNASGLIVNVTMCYLLIPFFGIQGAALSFLMTHFFASFLVTGFFSNTRVIFCYLIRCIFHRNSR